MCVYLFAVVWLSCSMQLHTAPTFLLTSVTPMSPRWLGSFLLNKSLTWKTERQKERKKDTKISTFESNQSTDVDYMTCGPAGLNACAVLTFAPTALPRLMAFLSLCWPPEDGESTEQDPGLGLAEAGERRAEGGPGLEIWGLCCWAVEFSNILWSTGKKKEDRRQKDKTCEYTAGFNQRF